MRCGGVFIALMPPCSFDLEKTQDHEKKMELYDRLFVAFNNALQAIRDDMNDLVPLSLSLSLSRSVNLCLLPCTIRLPYGLSSAVAAGSEREEGGEAAGGRGNAAGAAQVRHPPEDQSHHRPQPPHGRGRPAPLRRPRCAAPPPPRSHPICLHATINLIARFACV